MSGFTEILVVLVIVLGIVLLPRRLGRQEENIVQSQSRITSLTGWTRLALFISIFWPAFFVIYLRPWEGHWPAFLTLALGPVIIGWCVFWVFSGFKRKGR